MARDPAPDREPPPPPENEPGRLATTASSSIFGLALAGLVAGWLVRPVCMWLDRTAPRVGWLPALALALAAAILVGVAVSTNRTLHRRRQRLEPHQAVNRLVLAKASALAGALVAGGYLGYALSWVGSSSELAGERGFRSLAAGVAGAALTVAALFLERACRIRDEE